MPLLTYRETAKALGVSRRTVRRWRQQGMDMSWGKRDGQNVRVVELRVARAWFRERRKNDPITQQRIRAEKRREEAAHGSTRRV